MEIQNSSRAVIAHQIFAAPRVSRLIDSDIGPAGNQFGCDTSQKVRIAVIPVGYKRVIEHHDAHKPNQSPNVSIGAGSRTSSP